MRLSDGELRWMQARLAQRYAAAGRDAQEKLERQLAVLAPDQALLTSWCYAASPLSDWANYDFSLFSSCAAHALHLWEQSPSVRALPEQLFLNYVLHPRVNEEELCDCRGVFYAQLAERIQGLSACEAILAINAWNAEQVCYRSTDGRTISALGAQRSGFGRCGEESTFAVNALRAAGIPARQVYTPRWAHTDDNHAWVEAWADGHWYFFGACEPEPVLNLGWFNSPASRGMLMHTKVFGRYNGPEEIMLETPNYTEINVIDNYAPTAKAIVTVTDADGQPVADAKVEFKIYNYAEFYTVATKYTDAEGKASLTAGKGDMLVWASRNGQFGYAKISFGKDDALQLSLNRKEGEVYSLPMDLVPPVEGANIPEVTPEQRVENDRRMVQEDSIRNAYVATMMTEKQAKEWIDKLYGNTLQPEKKEKLVNFLVASRGNHQTLKDFLSAIRKEKDAVSWEEIRAIWILESLSAKDLRDVTLDVLNDHLLTNISDWEKIEADLFKRMYLNPPRIANEMLTPYKKVLREAIEKTVYQSVPDSMKRDPKVLIEWCRKEIKINNELNSQQIPISPMGVWKARVADEKSRDIFFVAAYRSMGWASAAWIDEVTGKVQILNEEFAKEDVNFDTAEAAQSRKGVLQATYTPIRSVEDPKYYSHFTLSKFKNGTFQLLNYDEGETDMGDGTTWRNLLKYGRELDEGYYMMVTGTRLASGAVLSNSTFFTIEPGKTTTVDLVMRESKDQVQVIGNFNSEATYRPVDSTEQRSILQTCGRGYFVVAVLGVGQEPTNHALRDIAALGNDFEQWGRKMVFLFPSEEQYKKFNADEFKRLPSTITYGIDIDDSIRKEIVQAMNLNNSILPVFIIADTFNRVVFVSQGYTIGLGEQLMKVVHGL